MLIIATVLVAFGCSKSDDNTITPVKPVVIIPVTEYKTAILKDWKLEKKQFLDKDAKVIKEIDFKVGNDCPLEKWKFEQETLTMFKYITDGIEQCREVGTPMKYSVHEGKFYFFYPSEGSFILNVFDFKVFNKDNFTIREDYEYSEEDAEFFNYPKGTKYVQMFFKL